MKNIKNRETWYPNRKAWRRTVSETMNCQEVMRALRLSRETVRALMDSGELRGFRRGKVIRVSRESVEKLLNGSKMKGDFVNATGKGAG